METKNPNGESKRRGSRRWIYAAIGVVILVIIAAVIFLVVPGISVAPTPSTTSFSVLVGSQVVSSGNYIYSTFNLGNKYLSNYLVGNFSSVGTGGDDGIRMILFNDTNFKIFQNTGIAVGVLYETGLVSSATMDVKLPQTGIEYVIVFDNSMDSSNSKTISGSMYVVSSNQG